MLQLWVPDPKTPAFRNEAARQANVLRGTPEEIEALDFIQAAAEWQES